MFPSSTRCLVWLACGSLFGIAPTLSHDSPSRAVATPKSHDSPSRASVAWPHPNPSRCLAAGKSHDSESRATTSELRMREVVRIWDAAPHNAFTDLVWHEGHWYCVFREGGAHVSPDGALRVLRSTDGRRWESAALLRSDASDLRDAKLAVTPAGELMLSGAAALHDRSRQTHQSLVWFSRDGREWSEPVPVADPDVWLWRVTWHGDRAYGLGYGCGDERYVRLYTSRDGRRFETLVDRLFDQGYPNESSLVFEGDRAFCLLRRDGEPANGLLGESQAPFTEWTWRDLGQKIGGPMMLRLPDGRLLAAVRLYDQRVRTALCWVDPQAGTLTEALELPSGGDTSYAGMVWRDDLLWVSYYSSHEGKSSIYLATVEVGASE